jgi:hypothetical protein
MAFRFHESMCDQYLTQGYMIFRGIVPVSLLSDLRREADRARALAHDVNGAQTQRIQPLLKFADRINIQPFEDYCQLPALHNAVTRLLGPHYSPGQTRIMGLLVEPLNHPWTCGWHRDGVVELRPEVRDDKVRAKLHEMWYDLRVFNQVNCAIYSDTCTWFVPGSHLRQYDLPGEVESTYDEAFKKRLTKLSYVAAERALMDHGRNFPGAIQVHLHAGDYMIYRNHGWHNGIYLPYQPRATIHDTVLYSGDKHDHKYWETKKEAQARYDAAQAAKAQPA